MTAPLVLVGNAQDGTISSYRLNHDTLRPLAVSDIGVGCSTFVVDHQRSLLHVASKVGPSIVTCRLDRMAGTVTPLNRVTAAGNPTYLELTHDGSVLLTAYYHEGIGDARPVIDGAVGDVVGRIENANLHCVVASSDSRHASFVSLGDDLIATCEVGPDATLTRLSDAPAPGGSGPRHLVFDADETNAYVVTEFSGEILRFRRDPDSGELTPAGATSVVDPSYGLHHSRYGANPRDEHLIWGADLHLSADGGVVWSTERTESVLATSPISESGAVETPVAFTPTETQPRGFNVSPDGRHLVVTGERSDTISLYRVGEQGIPQHAGTFPAGAGACWVRFA